MLFFRMADGQSRAPFNKPSPIPKNVDWQSPRWFDDDEVETHYRHVLESLGKEKGMLGALPVNLENVTEESKMSKRNTRLVLTGNENKAQRDKPAFSLEEFESGKIAVNPRWLKEVWAKWPRDETIEELLAALDGGRFPKNHKRERRP